MLILYGCLYETIANGLDLWLESQIPVWAHSGINGLMYPPDRQTQYGPGSTSMGYDPIADLNVGQFAGNPLRWGTAEDRRDLIALAHRWGMQFLIDRCIHQYGGRPPLIERGSDGRPDPTLFPKGPLCFVPQAKVDKVFDADGNMADGLMVSYQGDSPRGYMLEWKIRSIKWSQRRFGEDGGRIDEAKGESTDTLNAFRHALGGTLVAEVYTGNRAELREFRRRTTIPVYDFPFHFACRAVSQGAPLSTLPGNAYAADDPDGSYLYVESHDTDGPNGIVNNKLWFYLWMLTGMPARGCQLYGGDFRKYNLGVYILRMVYASRRFAFGPVSILHADNSLLIWGRNGDGGEFGWSGGLLCAISSEPIASRSMWVNCSWFGPNAHLRDTLRNGPDIWTNADGWVNLTVGPNEYGSAQNGVAYARVEGMGALDIQPLPNHQNGASFIDFSDL